MKEMYKNLRFPMEKDNILLNSKNNHGKPGVSSPTDLSASKSFCLNFCQYVT